MSEALVNVSGMIEDITAKAINLPGVQISRDKFLRNNLKSCCTESELERAISMGTMRANIPVETLDKVAKSVIESEALQTTAISAAAGIPGGAAMFATIPMDLAQFHAHLLRTVQELAYIYGWKDFADFDEGTKSQMHIFIGVMSGVDFANRALTTLFVKQATKFATEKAAADAFAKKWYIPLLKIIARKSVEKKTTVPASKLVLAKTLPVIGGLMSGGLTWAMFRPMAYKLQKHLSDLAHMSPEQLRQYEEEIIIDVNEYEMLQ